MIIIITVIKISKYGTKIKFNISLWFVFCSSCIVLFKVFLFLIIFIFFLGSSVLFISVFLSLFGQIDNIYMVE